MRNKLSKSTPRSAFALWLLGLIAVVLVTLLLMTPLLLQWMSNLYSPSELKNLSEIGNVFAFFSALVSGFALAGVVFSLYLQRRAGQASMLSDLRNLHVDLLRMSLEDELYLRCWGEFSTASTTDGYKQHIYLNMIIQHWQLMFELGALGNDQLTNMAEDLMRSEPARMYWEDARKAREISTIGRQHRKFLSVLDSAYDQTSLA